LIILKLYVWPTNCTSVELIEENNLTDRLTTIGWQYNFGAGSAIGDPEPNQDAGDDEDRGYKLNKGPIPSHPPLLQTLQRVPQRTMLETGSFADTWWYVHGNFEGGVIRWQGDVSEAYVPGYTIADYRRISPSMELPQFTKDDRDFRFIDDVAYLRPGLFLNLESSNISEHEAFESGEFLHFLDSAFAAIAAGKPSSLIIDMRGNNGGDNSFSDLMIAYFADRPFRMTSRFSVRTSELTKT
jgi:hypothetical protein